MVFKLQRFDASIQIKLDSRKGQSNPTKSCGKMVLDSSAHFSVVETGVVVESNFEYDNGIT